MTSQISGHLETTICCTGISFSFEMLTENRSSCLQRKCQLFCELVVLHLQFFEVALFGKFNLVRVFVHERSMKTQEPFSPKKNADIYLFKNENI